MTRRGRECDNSGCDLYDCEHSAILCRQAEEARCKILDALKGYGTRPDPVTVTQIAKLLGIELTPEPEIS
ncbi:hypothetical protein [Halioglobus sp. HI00S01]|uniref:hypothetical protein n=1 Tax=Halioglobus sp. HI00S01 TaxID=1822214 RepID=UPI0012E82AE4|nr:hypothetical protein [Halioglobus sp. HI00S01]